MRCLLFPVVVLVILTLVSQILSSFQTNVVKVIVAYLITHYPSYFFALSCMSQVYCIYALLVFVHHGCVGNFYFWLVKLERQLDGINQVAVLMHNDCLYLSQEILGLAFEVYRV